MKDYMIYRLENSKIEDEVLGFFLPERGEDKNDVFKRKVRRHLLLRDYKSKGYVVTSVLYVDRETYLNARLDEKVREYCLLDKREQKERSLSYSIVRYRTIGLIHEQKMTLLKVIASLVRRMYREDLDVHNEIAIMLYDKYIRF